MYSLTISISMWFTPCNRFFLESEINRIELN